MVLIRYGRFGRKSNQTHGLAFVAKTSTTEIAVITFHTVIVS